MLEKFSAFSLHEVQVTSVSFLIIEGFIHVRNHKQRPFWRGQDLLDVHLRMKDRAQEPQISEFSNQFAPGMGNAPKWW